MIVFARQPDQPLGQLLIQLDQLLRQQKDNTLPIWVTFLSQEQPQLDEKLVAWSKQLGLARLPISIFEDDRGPPAYRLPQNGAVVVVLAAERKILTCRVYNAQQCLTQELEPLMREIRSFLEKHHPVRDRTK